MKYLSVAPLHAPPQKQEADFSIFHFLFFSHSEPSSVFTQARSTRATFPRSFCQPSR